MRLLDVLLSFPSLLLALVLLERVGPSNVNLVAGRDRSLHRR